tara:strand:- start:7356 stop:7679 length:324 start_codon:yes stop_codon:yes gene_type:complete
MNSLASEDYNQEYLYDQQDLHTDKDEISITLPKGKLGITLSRIGDQTVIIRIHNDSKLKGILEKNDHLYEVNGIELKHFNINEITKIFKAGNNNERILKIMRPKIFF